MTQQAYFDWDLIQRYDASGPRYTSYPTAVQFNDSFSIVDYRKSALESNVQDAKPLSLYLHLPFCSTLCFYCACNKIVTKNRAKGEEYLTRLFREIDYQSKLFDADRTVEQIHLGGGTPTFFDSHQLEQLLTEIEERFVLSNSDHHDFSIEVDPRTVDPDAVQDLWDIGFNRMSLGVQDFDPDVQQAVHRIQSIQSTLAVLQAARDVGFRSLNVDLIYGLPLQNTTSFGNTLETVIGANPDRVCIFNYAHLPKRFAPQQRIREQDLPSPDEKLAILQLAVNMLTDAGYRYIGMDHFAKPEDELALAQENGTLYRNFQGYTTHADCDLIGMGVSSISRVSDCYSQNFHDTETYYDRIDKGLLPVARGVLLDRDDQLRREIINDLMCYGTVDIPALEKHHDIRFTEYFSAEIQVLNSMQDDELITLEPERIDVTPQGWSLIRNVCMVFDKYLGQSPTNRFSRLI